MNQQYFGYKNEKEMQQACQQAIMVFNQYGLYKLITKTEE